MGKNLEVSALYINTNESKVSHEEKQIKKKNFMTLFMDGFQLPQG